MIEFRKKTSVEKLIEQLEKEKNENAELAGYGLLPGATAEKVYNVPNSNLYKDPNGKSCIEYWEDKTGCEIKEDLNYYCPACGKAMSKKDNTLHGAHVYKQGNHKLWYFVPLCSTCNNPANSNAMQIDVVLVPVPNECYEEKQ